MCISKVKISKKNFHYHNHKDYCTIHNLPDNHKDLSPKEGLIILIQKTLCQNPPTITHLHPGRATSIEFNLDNKPFKCFCLYAPSQGDSVSHSFFWGSFQHPPPWPHAKHHLHWRFQCCPKPGTRQKEPKNQLSQTKDPQTLNQLHAWPRISRSLEDPTPKWHTILLGQQNICIQNWLCTSISQFIPSSLQHHIHQPPVRHRSPGSHPLHKPK